MQPLYDDAVPPGRIHPVASPGSAYGPMRSYGSSLQVAQTAPPQTNTLLGSVENALSDLLTRVNANAAHLRAIADRVIGTQPEPVAGKGETPPANPPSLRRIEDLIGMLHASIADLGNQVDRLDRL